MNFFWGNIRRFYALTISCIQLLLRAASRELNQQSCHPPSHNSGGWCQDATETHLELDRPWSNRRRSSSPASYFPTFVVSLPNKWLECSSRIGDRPNRGTVASCYMVGSFVRMLLTYPPPHYTAYLLGLNFFSFVFFFFFFDPKKVQTGEIKFRPPPPKTSATSQYEEAIRAMHYKVKLTDVRISLYLQSNVNMGREDLW